MVTDAAGETAPSEEPLYVACAPDVCTGNNTCATGYMGMLCGECGAPRGRARCCRCAGAAAGWNWGRPSSTIASRLARSVI